MPQATCRQRYERGTRASATAISLQSAKKWKELESGNISKSPEGMDKEIIYPLDNLIEEIISEENMYESFDYVIKHLENPKQRETYWPRREKIVKSLISLISTGSFRILRSEVKDIHVTDGPKERDVQAPTVYKRIGIHAIMVVVERYTYPTLIKNTAASVKGKGMHWLHHIVEEDLVNAPEQTRFYYQNDVKHFFDNIDQDIMKQEIRKYISDPVLLPMLDCFVTLMPKGLSKGLRSSQCFANLYLSPVDHEMLKHVQKYRHETDKENAETRFLYYRFMDDTVIWGSSKKQLWNLRNLHVKLLRQRKLTINAKEAIRPISEGLNFLGYIQYEDYALIRKRTKQKAARKLAKVKSRKRRQEIIGSFNGMACHADCKNLYKKLTGKKMRKFNEMGVAYTPADGKKRFPGKVTRLSNISNKTIEIHDYETGVNTSQGEDRYVVSFFDPQKKEWGKFFTSSEEMKNILDQISDIEDGFPFETVIESEMFDGNKVRYKFT